MTRDGNFFSQNKFAYPPQCGYICGKYVKIMAKTSLHVAAIAVLMVPAVYGLTGRASASSPAPRTTWTVAPPDTLADDTLLPVIITEDGNIPIKINKPKPIKVPSVSDILGKDLTDKIMHPFAFSKRKRERHRRKMMKILEEYDKVKTPRELLIEALRNEGIDVDSLLKINGVK